MTSSRRIIAIGDIHGCSTKLHDLLERLSLRDEDTAVFLGDYIGRGPDSKEVISTLVQLQKTFERVVCLLGNHENLLLEYVKAPDEALIPYLRQQKIENFLRSYGEEDLSRLHTLSFMPEEHTRFLKNLKLFHEEGEYFFVHAGVRPDIALEKQTAMDFCEVRDIFLESRVTFGKTVIFGHTPFELPLVTEDKIGIDTGAAYGNLLTAVVLPERKFVHA